MHENVIFGLKITHFWMKMKIWFQQETKILRPYNYKVKRRLRTCDFLSPKYSRITKTAFYDFEDQERVNKNIHLYKHKLDTIWFDFLDRFIWKPWTSWTPTISDKSNLEHIEFERSYYCLNSGSLNSG